ncbi:hypothetical protein EHM69_09900 [candidate division KSB1 bacterium]|nr:MAG: hypothetical protein EHM69_09900 [candidate division KSB1 bacterium]
MIVLTHTGKLGDFFLAMPVASWLYKKTGEKIHWVLSSEFKPFTTIEPLLFLQEMTGKVTLVPHHIRNYKCGGQPYRFDPAKYGVEDKPYYNIGFRHLPDKYVPDFYAEEIGAGVDDDFVLNAGPARKDFSDKIVFVDDGRQLRNYIDPAAVELTIDQPLEVNLALALGAREVHCGDSGFAVAADLAAIRNLHIWNHGRSAQPEYYHRHPERIQFYRRREKPRFWAYE